MNLCHKLLTCTSLGPSGVQPVIKKIPVVASDSDSDDEETPGKSQGVFSSSQQYPKTDMQEKRDDAEELTTRGSVYSITALIIYANRTYLQIHIALL